MKISKTIMPLLLGAALLALPTSALAQTGGGGTSGGTSGSTTGTTGTTTTTTDTANRGFDWGWLGLLGLLGLAGMRRPSSDVYTSTGGGRSTTP